MTILSSENGLLESFDYDPINDQMCITTTEDVAPLLDKMSSERKADLWDKQVKKDWVKFCSIPVTVEMELRKRGIRLEDKNCTKKLMQIIQTEYPYLLTHDNKRFA